MRNFGSPKGRTLKDERAKLLYIVVGLSLLCDTEKICVQFLERKVRTLIAFIPNKIDFLSDNFLLLILNIKLNICPSNPHRIITNGIYIKLNDQIYLQFPDRQYYPFCGQNNLKNIVTRIIENLVGTIKYDQIFSFPSSFVYACSWLQIVRENPLYMLQKGEQLELMLDFHLKYKSSL